MLPGDRGSGRTTKQLEGAPKGAVFVWCSNAVHYPKELAQKIGREDLKIVGPEWLTREDWRGLELSGLIVDHAAHFDKRQHEAYEHARTRVRPRS